MNRLIRRQFKSDPWSTLNIRRDANRGEVKSAFIHLARLHHPDNNHGKGIFIEIFVNSNLPEKSFL